MRFWKKVGLKSTQDSPEKMDNREIIYWLEVYIAHEWQLSWRQKLLRKFTATFKTLLPTVKSETTF